MGQVFWPNIESFARETPWPFERFSSPHNSSIRQSTFSGELTGLFAPSRGRRLSFERSVQHKPLCQRSSPFEEHSDPVPVGKSSWGIERSPFFTANTAYPGVHFVRSLTGLGTASRSMRCRLPTHNGPHAFGAVQLKRHPRSKFTVSTMVLEKFLNLPLALTIERAYIHTCRCVLLTRPAIFILRVRKDDGYERTQSFNTADSVDHRGF